MRKKRFTFTIPCTVAEGTKSSVPTELVVQVRAETMEQATDMLGRALEEIAQGKPMEGPVMEGFAFGSLTRGDD